MLKAENIEVWRGNTQVLSGLNLAIRPGIVTALLGGNGSGKSTTLYALSGLIPLKAGEIYVGDERLTGVGARKAVKLGIAHVPQGREVFPSLSIKDNLMAGAATVASRKMRLERLEKVLEIYPMLSRKLKVVAGALSGGEQQQVAIGRALMSDPKVVMMDEPSAGLSPNMVDTLIDTIRTLGERGLTVLLVEQNVGVAMHSATDAIVLKAGVIAVSRPASELFSDRALLAAYLGH
ncbi:ABC transporter ATP-binding protein [Candidimonas nitroreducens]|uniref:ABC transporter ATP-binding protein n=1 Tax=Candidimonas nitroreducens TaxID=683354 RepID=A0A225MRP0_9BURK|nr:ABC transporter ATP-binding protein [Candidimonas nitroreducens]OWT63936.1 ABC transporter ATP-binding protein [Candidimonas nitroreducens]